MGYTSLKKKLIPDYSIYAVIDVSACGKRRIDKIVNDCLAAKVEIIQLRDKSNDSAGFLKIALTLKKLIGGKALFIINDRVDIAKLCASDGLHLGQDDIPIDAARRLLGQDIVIGKSCHNLKQALSAYKEGADYIGFGPIFKTPTKPDYKVTGIQPLRRVCSQLAIPVTAIGGININNAKFLRKTGVKTIAVVRAVCKAENMTNAVNRLRKGAFAR